MSFRALLLAIHALPGLAWNEKLSLLAAAPDFAALCALSAADVEMICGRPLRNRRWQPEELADTAAVTEKALLRRNIQVVDYHNPLYPPQLREIFDPPFLLFCRGELSAWEFTSLAIVGTRHPSGGGRRAAWELGRGAAESGIAVVSGLALGIDGEAHKGCLAAGGKTIAVLGNGADMIFPSSHKALASRILDKGGLILTEYAPGAGVRKFFFPARNRIVSGLSRALVVVEAPLKSGALITADFALQHGRDLYVHEAGLRSAGGDGTRKLAEDGAPVIASLDELVHDWGEPLSGGTNRGPGTRLSPAGENRSPGKIQAFFLEEELAGNLTRCEGNYFRSKQDG